MKKFYDAPEIVITKINLLKEGETGSPNFGAEGTESESGEVKPDLK